MRFTKIAHLADHQKDLEFAIQLMMSRNACNSALHWHELLAKSPQRNPLDGIAVLLAIGGWRGEAVNTLREGHKRALVNRKMLEEFPDCLQT